MCAPAGGGRCQVVFVASETGVTRISLQLSQSKSTQQYRVVNNLLLGATKTTFSIRAQKH